MVCFVLTIRSYKQLGWATSLLMHINHIIFVGLRKTFNIHQPAISDLDQIIKLKGKTYQGGRSVSNAQGS